MCIFDEFDPEEDEYYIFDKAKNTFIKVNPKDEK
jgi:hypothetical protein